MKLDSEVKSFHSHGKLMLTGEYLVLDGALALALPTKKGQSLTVRSSNINNQIHWQSFDCEGELWLDAKFDSTLQLTSCSDEDRVEILQKLLIRANELNPFFLEDNSSLTMLAELEFPNDWGLGSSSTLVANIAKCFEVDPYELQFSVLGGSGYDIACAITGQPLIYGLSASKQPQVTPVEFNPEFAAHLFFVHLNQKQNSRNEISKYKAQGGGHENAIREVSEITSSILEAENIKAFEQLLIKHEEIMSAVLGVPTIKEDRFSDYHGLVKSLGAWGGDFVLCTGDEKDMEYFRNKGYHTTIPYEKMVL